MGKYERRLAKKLGKALEMTPLQETSQQDGPHGCDVCRSVEKRRELISLLMLKSNGKPCDSITRCIVCGNDWREALFAEETGQACVRFEPQRKTRESAN